MLYTCWSKAAILFSDTDITLRNDHLPLKRFLKRKVLNSNVKNWALETEKYKIKLEYIKGIKTP